MSLERVEIQSVGHRGDGVADVGGMRVFVPWTLPGETVEVEPGPRANTRRPVAIAAWSPDRVEPVCPHFGVCGGCQLQHWAPAPYLAWKRERVIESLAEAGISAPVAAVRDAHGEGRRRAVLHARRGANQTLSVGFSALRAHEIVPIEACPVFAPGLAGAVEAAWAFAEILTPTARPLDIQVTETENGLDIDVRGSGPLSPRLTVAASDIVEAHHLARFTRHGERIIERAPPTIRIGRARVVLPPGAFLQATAAGEAMLAELVAERVEGATTVADLFCGVGPFALRLAEKVKVIAADLDEPSVAALDQAARNTQGLKPIAAEPRDLFRRPLTAAELADVDTVVIDPPRQGAEEQARQIARSEVERVVSVSCDVVTFARDAAIYAEAGFVLDEVVPVDQFRYSTHVELVGTFSR